MTRRTLLKYAALLPFAGPILAKALSSAPGKSTAPVLPYLPAYFPNWDKSVDGLESVGAWVLEIESARVAAAGVLPKGGQIWEAKHDCEVAFRALIDSGPMPHATFAALSPMDLNLFFGLGTARLRRGERIRILEMNSKPVSAGFVPLRYDDLEACIIPQEIRDRPGYRGYELSVKLSRTISDSCRGTSDHQTFFNESFRFVADAS